MYARNVVQGLKQKNGRGSIVEQRLEKAWLTSEE
jgi:hypothetical protein